MEISTFNIEDRKIHKFEINNFKISIFDNPEYVILKVSIFDIQNIEKKNKYSDFFKTWYLFSNMILEGPITHGNTLRYVVINTSEYTC